jgi:hypothetical protein
LPVKQAITGKSARSSRLLPPPKVIFSAGNTSYNCQFSPGWQTMPAAVNGNPAGTIPFKAVKVPGSNDHTDSIAQKGVQMVSVCFIFASSPVMGSGCGRS